MVYQDFLPDYPLIADKDYFRRIVDKAEFWEKHDADSFFQHQVNIARYMSQWTMYDSIFLFHEMGTGKSGLTVALTEQVRPRSRVIYITHNQTQIDNYKSEIFKFSSRLASRVEGIGNTDEKFRRKWNAVLSKDGYEFYTLGTINGEFQKRTPEWIKSRYENCIILLDEAHHLVQTNKDEEKKSYSTIMRIIDTLSSRKLIVMTGTPVRDQPDEVVPLLNLVVPPSRRIKRSDFIGEFFETERKIAVLDRVEMPIYRWRHGMRERFQELIRGRVSYLRRETTNVSVEYVGDIRPPMQSTRVDVHFMTMDGIQNEEYLDVFQTECMGEEEEEEGDDTESVKFLKGVAAPAKKKASFYSKSKQCSLFVFPDGSFGDKGFARYITKDLTMRAEFLRVFGPNISLVPKEQILSTLSSFSATYSSVLSSILDRPQELVYVFSDLVEGSGILLFLSLLKSLFRFQVVSSPRDIQYTAGDRVICLNDRVTSEEDFQQLIAYFNDPGNKNGKYCQVILSTNKTKEGISLKNVQQIHIMTPSWNMGDTSQAIARSLRARSHVNLVNPRVRIFMHVAVPSIPAGEGDPLMYSIDFQRCYRSEIKERNAKLIDRVFLESSWDCMMNMPINMNTGRITDGSLECEYSTCEYTCEGVGPDDPRGTDRSNLNIYYGTVAEDLILEKIRTFFRKESICIRRDLVDFIDSDNHALVEKVLWKVIYSPVVLEDAGGRGVFLCEDKGYFFLVDNPFLPEQGIYAAYYQYHPSCRIDFDLSSVLDGYYTKNMRTLLCRLVRLIRNRHSNAKRFFMSFPLEIQRLFCEISIEIDVLRPEQMILPIRQWFVDEFRVEITFIPNVLIDHRFVIDKKRPRRLDLTNAKSGWKTVDLNPQPV